MKKLILILFFFPIIIQGQYYNNTVTEKGFEDSKIFFNRYNFNAFGLVNFQSVSIGMIDHPLVNILINPAYNTDTSNYLLYIDLRKEYFVYNYISIQPHYLDNFYPIYYQPPSNEITNPISR